MNIKGKYKKIWLCLKKRKIWLMVMTEEKMDNEQQTWNGNFSRCAGCSKDSEL